MKYALPWENESRTGLMSHLRAQAVASLTSLLEAAAILHLVEPHLFIHIMDRAIQPPSHR